MAQRLGSIDGGSMEQTVQALQGLTFNGGGDGIGIGLALLHARSQAATQAQAQAQVLSQQQQQQLAMMPPASLGSARATNGNGLRQIQARQAYGGIPTNRGGPADANAGPRIFLGKLNKETTEQDVKVCAHEVLQLSRKAEAIDRRHACPTSTRNAAADWTGEE